MARHIWDHVVKIGNKGESAILAASQQDEREHGSASTCRIDRSVSECALNQDTSPGRVAICHPQEITLWGKGTC